MTIDYAIAATVAGLMTIGGISFLLAVEDGNDLSKTTIISIAGVIIAAIAGAFSFVGKYLLDRQREELALVRAEKQRVWESSERWRDNSVMWYKQCRELASIVEQYINRERNAKGVADFVPIAPVIPEHHSPVSEQSQVDADRETMKARIVAVRKELGLELN